MHLHCGDQHLAGRIYGLIDALNMISNIAKINTHIFTDQFIVKPHQFIAMFVEHNADKCKRNGNLTLVNRIEFKYVD